MIDFTVDNMADPEGAYLQARLRIPPRKLVEVFGEPLEGDGCNTSGEYTFVGSDGSLWTIYEWQKTSVHDPLLDDPDQFWTSPIYETFHVGGRDDQDLHAFLYWLRDQFPGFLVKVSIA